jgi:hypothetical protein
MNATCLLAILLGLPLAGELPPPPRIWIVDQRGGPGVDFTDIPPAVAAARPGDRIEVRAAAQAYTEFTLRAGVDMHAEPGVMVPRIEVRDVPAAETAVLRGFTLWGEQPPLTFAGRVTVAGCAGAVILRSLTLRNSSTAWVLGRDGAIAIADSDAVLLADCVVQGGRGGPDRAGVRVTNSRVALQRGAIHGGDGYMAQLEYIPAAPGAAGLACVRSQVVAAGVTFVGGQGGAGQTTYRHCPARGGNAAEGDGGLLMAACTLVRGAGGTGGPSLRSPAPDGLAVSGSFEITSDCALTGALGSRA